MQNSKSVLCFSKVAIWSKRKLLIPEVGRRKFHVDSSKNLRVLLQMNNGFVCFHLIYIYFSRLPVRLIVSETYSKPCQTSKLELFANIINGFHIFSTFHFKSFILDVCQGSKYAYGT